MLALDVLNWHLKRKTGTKLSGETFQIFQPPSSRAKPGSRRNRNGQVHQVRSDQVVQSPEPKKVNPGASRPDSQSQKPCPNWCRLTGEHQKPGTFAVLVCGANHGGSRTISFTKLRLVASCSICPNSPTPASQELLHLEISPHRKNALSNCLITRVLHAETSVSTPDI